MLIQIDRNKRTLLKIIVVVVAICSLEEPIEAQSLRSSTILHGGVEKVGKSCSTSPWSALECIIQTLHLLVKVRLRGTVSLVVLRVQPSRVEKGIRQTQ